MPLRRGVGPSDDVHAEVDGLRRGPHAHLGRDGERREHDVAEAVRRRLVVAARVVVRASCGRDRMSGRHRGVGVRLPGVLSCNRFVCTRDEVRRLDGDEDREQRGEGWE